MLDKGLEIKHWTPKQLTEYLRRSGPMLGPRFSGKKAQQYNYSPAEGAQWEIYLKVTFKGVDLMKYAGLEWDKGDEYRSSDCY